MKNNRRKKIIEETTKKGDFEMENAIKELFEKIKEYSNFSEEEDGEKFTTEDTIYMLIAYLNELMEY